MSSNLPPGVTDGMIPGNRAEDLEWEEFHEEVDKDIKYYGMSPDDANKAWSYGLGAWYYVHKGSQIDLIHADDPPVPDTGHGKA